MRFYHAAHSPPSDSLNQAGYPALFMDFNKYWHQNHVVGIISGQRELLPQLREKAASVGTRNIT